MSVVNRQSLSTFVQNTALLRWAFKSHLSGSVLFAPKYDTYNVTRASKSKHESHCISWAVFSCSFSHLLSSLEILLISILSHWSRIKRHIYTHRHKYISINKYIHKYKNIYTDTYSPINNLLYTQRQKVKHMYTTHQNASTTNQHLSTTKRMLTQLGAEAAAAPLPRRMRPEAVQSLLTTTTITATATTVYG